jgi:arabinofuranosyltransferase
VSASAVLGFLLVLFGWQNGAALAHKWLTVRNVNAHITSYVPAADFIRKANPDGTTIITCEPGAFAFRLGPKYEVIDELGLVSPNVAREIVKGDMDYPFMRWKPKYIIISWHGLYTPEGRPWLAQDYTPVLSFDGPWWRSFGIVTHVYQRNSGT